jgi:hypothetical protein
VVLSRPVRCTPLPLLPLNTCNDATGCHPRPSPSHRCTKQPLTYIIYILYRRVSRPCLWRQSGTCNKGHVTRNATLISLLPAVKHFMLTDYHPACFMTDVDHTLRKSHHCGMLQLATRHRKSRSHRSAVDAQRTEEKCLKFQGESHRYILNRKCHGPQSRARCYGEI